MSAPTDELQNLSLAGRNMSSRRSIAQQERRRRENEQRQRDEEARRSQQLRSVQPSASGTARPGRTSVAPTHILQSQSGIRYNASNMPQGAYARALKALSSQMYVADLAMRHRDDRGSYIAFQLKKLESIRVYEADSTTVPGRPTLSCTCEDFGSHGVCSHIYWLYDGLNDVLYDGAKTTVQDLDLYSIGSRLGSLSSQMSQRLSSLPDALNIRGENAECDLGDDYEDVLAIQDMISVMDEDRLPEEFDEDFMDALPPFTKSYQQLIVPEDMPASLFGLARYDHVLRDRLRNALPKELCAFNFLKKLDARVTLSFERFDDYASSGPDLRTAFVPSCARALRSIIHSIVDYQESRGPTSQSFDTRAAGITLRLLNGVADRDRDIYASCVWLGGRTPPALSSQRNLFTNLIRGPHSDDNDNPAAEELFGLDFLSNNLRISAWRHLLEPMQQLLRRVEGAQAPPAFVDKLRELLNLDHEAWGHMDPSRSTRRPAAASAVASEWEASLSRPASSLSRRPEPETQREPQRRRLD